MAGRDRLHRNSMRRSENDDLIGLSTLGNTAGTTAVRDFDQYVFQGSNGITLSQLTSGQSATLVISGPGGSGAGVALSAGSQSVNTGTMVFANSNGITFGMSGSSQITASVAGPTVSFLEAFGGAALNQTSAADLQLFMQRFTPHANISATRADLIMHISNSSNAGGTVTMRIGFYTMSGSTASLASSGSRTFAYNSTLVGSSYTDASGYRNRSIPVAFNVTPGDYMVGVVLSIATALTSGTYSWRARNDVTFAAVEYGTALTLPYFGFGSFSGVTAQLRNSVGLNQLSQQGGADLYDQPWFALVGSF